MLDMRHDLVDELAVRAAEPAGLSPLELLDLAVGDVEVGAQARYLRAQAADLSLGAVHPAHEVSTLLVELAL